MKLLQGLIFCCLLTLLWGSSSGQDVNGELLPIRLSDYIQNPKNNFFHYWIDQNSNLNKDSLPISEATQASLADHPAISSKPLPHWVKFTLLNDTGTPQEIFIEFDTYWSEVILFEEHSPGDFTKQYSGANYFAEDRAVWLRNRNVFKLNIGKEEQKTFYAQLQWSHQVSSQPYSLALSIESSEKILETEEAQLILSVFLLGCLFIMFTYNTFIWWSTRNISYFYYICIIALNMFTIFNNTGLVWHFLRNSWVFYLDLFFSACYGFSIIGFTIVFLQTKKLSLFMHRVLQTLYIPVTLMMLPLLWGDSLLANTFSSLTGLLTLLVVLISGIVVSIKHKKRPHYYFTLAYLFFAAGIWIALLSMLNVLTFNIFTMNSIQIASVIEASLFSLALADRMNVLKKENEEKQTLIIKQLKENETLQTKVNRELEEKVEERTTALRAQKDEIEQKKSDLEQLTEEISMQRDALLEQNLIIAEQRDALVDKNKLIERKNKNILSSIHYAKRIQAAILPEEKRVDRFSWS